MSTPGNIFMFRSDKAAGICGFSGESKGTALPAKFAPWTGFGVVRADQRMPHGFSRDTIEAAIDTEGYQLWREKKKA
jgi:hypothetical protein